jgi:anti-sigma B factor antagonist
MNDHPVLLDLSISASDGAANEACNALREALQVRFVGDGAIKRLFGIELVAREAVQNSVDYGCGADPRDRVSLVVWMEDDSLLLRVSDSGPGFDCGDVGEADPEGMPGTSGNGIRIIAAYSDRYRYENGGRTLTAEFVVGQENVMQEVQSIKVWAPKTDLVAANVPRAKEELRELVASSGGEFTVDLSGVSMIDSKGLGILIAAVNSLEAAGRKLRVTGSNPDLVELFKLMRLDRHLTIE